MRHLLVLTLSLSAGPRGDRPALWKALWVSLCCWLEEKGGVQTDVSVSTFSPRKLFEKDVSGTIINAFYKFSSNCWPIFFFLSMWCKLSLFSSLLAYVHRMGLGYGAEHEWTTVCWTMLIWRRATVHVCQYTVLSLKANCWESQLHVCVELLVVFVVSVAVGVALHHAVMESGTKLFS